MVEGLTQLEESFESLTQLGPFLLQEARFQSEGAWSESDRLELKGKAKPFYDLIVGKDELAQQPPWLKRLASQQLGGEELFVLRPLPPGFSSQVESVQAPEHYLVFGSYLPLNIPVLCSLDWAHLEQVWLPKRLGGFGVAGDLRGRLLSTEESIDSQPRREFPPVVLSGVFFDDYTSIWVVPSVRLSQAGVFPSVELTLDCTKLIRDQLYLQIMYLGGGLVLMLGFAVVLVLASRALRKEAEYLEARARFVSMVGHELRTPVTALEMYLEILRDGLVEDEEKIAQYHGILQTESRRLKSIVENLLTLGLHQNQGVELELVSVPLKPLLSSIVGQLNLQRREVELDFDHDSVAVIGDEVAIYSVFSNLVANALKYSPPETTVSIKVRSEGGLCLIEVVNEGTTLEPEQYAKLFQPYYRASRTSKGLGLGLALVALLTQAMGGKARAEGKDGGGSVVTVQLPLDQ